MSKIDLLQSIYSKLEDKRPFTWLNGRSYSDAFVICVGAGPWKFERRKKIQALALAKLAGRDIIEISNIVDWYPLDWQNKFLNNLRDSLLQDEYKFSFNQFCSSGKSVGSYTFNEVLYKKCGCNKNVKVLSLFCRDAMGVTAFPIDRHVKQFLIENNLPANESAMINLCLEANLNPNDVAVAFVRAASSMDNPDWSI